VRVVAALGGNALARRGERLEAAAQERRVAAASEVLAPLARDHELVVTHGNGPQVGWLAQAGDGRPLDALDAETEGLIGYWIERELAGRLVGRDVATLLTRVEVDPGDPAFRDPTKPIGPVLDEAAARRLAEELGWTVAPEAAGWRRVVPSPEPRGLPGLRVVEVLLGAGVTVVCTGGGGIPVVSGQDGRQRGVEAVVDKDLASALLATRLGADALLLLTDVPGVYADWPEPARELLGRISEAELAGLALEPGSMAPKVEAARRFVAAGGAHAAIGALGDAAALLAGTAGTRVVTAAARAPA
jgi:carbamate kinase